MNLSLAGFSLSLNPPLQSASGALTSRQGIMTMISNEVQGYGEAAPLPGWTESLATCRSALHSVRDNWRNIDRNTALNRLSTTPAARHGLSLALLDYDAKHESTPLYKHLGRSHQITDVPVNATIDILPLDETRARVQTALEEDYRAIKLKVTNKPFDAELDRILTVIDMLPRNTTLRLDANGSWSLETATAMLTRLSSEPITYIEQPLPPDSDLTYYASFREHGIPIAIDEAQTVYTPSELLSHPGIDILILKPMVLGGLDRAIDVAEIANDHGIETVVTTTFDSVIARTAAIHLAAYLSSPYANGLATANRLASDLGPDPASITNGTIAVPQTPGIGVTPTTQP